MSYMAQRVRPYSTTIFTEMTQLANQYNAVNLGQGFPDYPAPDFVKAAVKQAMDDDINQYPPPFGRLRLRQAIAATLQKQHGLILDPDREIRATHGATEAIFATIQALIDPGDEVIIIEPYFDSYVPSIQFAGGIPRFYPLLPPHWQLDGDALAALFNNKTKAILLNTPHNPTGKVFSADELRIIAELCQKWDVLAISDEVYEQLLFDGTQHIPIATLDGMAERTVTISSIGKTFSVTGWKVGWVYASADLCTAIFRARQWITFAGAAPLEEASAVALESADTLNYYPSLRESLQARRDLLFKGLAEIGLNPMLPQGGYFIMADITHLNYPDDLTFCVELTRDYGVTAIPPSSFYPNRPNNTQLARFAFCKQEATLQRALQRLQPLVNLTH